MTENDDTDGGNSVDPSTSSTSLVGCRLDEYQVLRKLGRGGMADVYAAKQLSLGRDVALKVLRKQFSRDEAYVKRFRREARAAAKLNHPNIVGVYDVKHVDDLHFIAQELIDGQNLREKLDRRGPLSAAEAIDVLLSVGEALEVAGEQGITHRDIKPENIMQSSRGQIKVADFGLARLGPEPGKSHAELTQAGLTLGTPRYMSPEQIQGRGVDARSDLYSLGVSVYHLLTGRPPFEAEDPLALAVMHLHETPMPIDKARGSEDLPEWLVAIISRLMSKLPEDRYQSASELVDAVRSQTDGVSTIGIGTAAASTRLQRAAAESRRKRRRRFLRVAAIIGLPLLSCSVAAVWARQRPASSVDALLNPTTVRRSDSISEQWIEAVRRDDAAGWKAVMEYFPADDKATETTREYNKKARIQLGRHLIEQQQWPEAARVLDRMLGDPNVRDLYRATALILRAQVATADGNKQEASKFRRDADNEIKALQTNNPSDLDVVEDVFTRQELMDAGVILDES